MPRLSFPSPDTMSPEQLAVHQKVVSGPRGEIKGPLRAALHNAELADRWQALGALLRYQTTLTPRQSELAILITGRHCRSPFEWHAHRPEAEKAGLPQPVIEAVLAQRRPEGLDATEAAIHDFALELNRTHSVSDATHAAAVKALGERGAVELTALVGYYTLVAMTLNAHEIPLPPGAEPAFPRPQDEPAAAGAR